MRDQRSWLQKIIWVYEYKFATKAISCLVILLFCLDAFANFLQVSGIAGSLGLFLQFMLLIVLILSVGILLAFPLRWWLLFKAVKGFVKAHLVTTLTKDKVLLGLGPGGAIATGMVAKAIRELGYEPPSVLVVDHRYELLGADPRLATLVPPDFRMISEKCWIVQGYIGTGKSLRLLKEKLSLNNSPVLTFVISSSAFIRENIDAALVIGSHDILPWPTEIAKPDNILKVYNINAEPKNTADPKGRTAD